MGKVVVLVRGKGTKTKAGDFKEVEFVDLGGDRVRDDKGVEFRMFVTHPDGGVLRNGGDHIQFKFPR